MLRDSSGRIYARLAADRGSPSLEFLDKNNSTAMTLFLNDKAGSMVLSSPNGAVSIWTYPTPQISLCRHDGAERVRIGLSGAAGAPEVGVLDEQGRTRASLSLDPNGKASLSLTMEEVIPTSGMLNRTLELSVGSEGDLSVDVQSKRGFKERQCDLHLGMDSDGNCALGGREEIMRALARGLALH
jgi:hypothetical protein